MAYALIHKGSDVKQVEDLRRLDWKRITGKDVSSATEASRIDVGISFEQRLRIEYDLVYSDGETERRELLLVLAKDERTVVSVNLDYRV